MLTNFIFLLIIQHFALSQNVLDFTIKTLWNSTSIDESDFIQLNLTASVDSKNFLVEIDAPFYRDPKPSGEIGPFPQLWNYEVVELFFLSSTSKHYIELEFSPHGHYLVLLLVDERKLLKQMLPLPLFSTNITENERWYGQALIPRAHLPANIDRFNAYAIHGQDEKRTYKALYPAPANSTKPDFHRLELFQPIDFDLILNIKDKDGDSWTVENSSNLVKPIDSILILLLIASIFLIKQ